MISLLFIAIIGLTIVISAAVIVYGNIYSASINEQGVYAYYVAESGAEEGLLRLLRNPDYPGESFSVGLGSVEVEVSTASGLITSVGTFNNAVRKIEVQTVYNNGMRTITSWKEVQ